jgi:hypothetical protein
MLAHITPKGITVGYDKGMPNINIKLRTTLLLWEKALGEEVDDKISVPFLLSSINDSIFNYI